MVNMVDAAKMANKPKKKWKKAAREIKEKPKKKTMADKVKSMYGSKKHG